MADSQMILMTCLTAMASVQVILIALTVNNTYKDLILKLTLTTCNEKNVFRRFKQRPFFAFLTKAEGPLLEMSNTFF